MIEFLSVEASGTEAVEDTWTRFVPSARLEHADPARLRFAWRSASAESFSVVAYELTAAVRSQIDPTGQFMACRLASRGAKVGNALRELHPGLPWVTAPGATRARWQGDAQVRAFIFDHFYAQDIARQISGDDRLSLRATDGTPRDAPSAARWEAVFRHVFDVLEDQRTQGYGGDGGGILEAELRRYALSATLMAFGSTFTDALTGDTQRRAAPRTLRRALAYIDAHAHEAVTVDDIAHAAGISSRGLQQVFRRHLEMTPLERVRSARLAGAREDLERGATTVAEVARRWGFSSPSRFARYYREAYGRTPSQTLRG